MNMSVEKGKNNQRPIAFSAMLGAMMTGSTLTWEQNRFSLTSTSVTQTLFISAIFGSLIGGIVANTMGRRRTMILTSVLFLYSWVILIFTVDSTMFFVARYISGLAIGLTSVVSRIYVAEIAEDSIRGDLLSLYYPMLYLGSFLMYVSQNYLVYCMRTEVMFALLTFVSVLVLSRIPESPTYLIKRNPFKAKKVLQGLRRCDTTEELKVISTNSGNSSTVLNQINYLTIPHTERKTLVTVLLLLTTQSFSGQLTMKHVSYNGLVYQGTVPQYNVLYSVLLLVQAIMSYLYCAYIPNNIRKLFYLVSSGLMIVCLIIVGVHFKFKMHFILGTWPIQLPVIGYILLFNLGIRPFLWIFMFEAFPKNIRTMVCCMSAALYWTFIYSENEIVTYYLYELGVHTFCLISIVFASLSHFCVLSVSWKD